MYIEINCVSYSFNCLVNALLQNSGLCLSTVSLYIYVYMLIIHIHMSVQFLQTNNLVLKFCNHCLAGCSSQEGSWEKKSISSLHDLPQIKIKALFCTSCFFSKKKLNNCSVSDKLRTLIMCLSCGTKSN